jgi:hypothetical protein
MYDMRFKNPLTCILAGPSQCGKSSFMVEILREIEQLFQDPRCKNNVIYYYKEDQPLYDVLREENVVQQWVNAPPTQEDIKNRTLAAKERGGSIVVIDDFANNLSKDIADIFSVTAHHTNSSIFLLTQNLFQKNNSFRTVSLNSKYIILFKNPRDSSQVMHYARQFSPGDGKYIIKSFKECTRRAYSYMLFDHHQSTPEYLRVRSNILPHELPMSVWTPVT